MPAFPSYQAPINSILQRRVNVLLTRQFEHGIALAYTKYVDALLYVNKYANLRHMIDKRYENTVMDFNHFYEYFVLYAIGVCLSIAVFVTEQLFYKIAQT